MGSEIDLHEVPYWAIQGEGCHVGTRMLFVRTQGCPVGCNYCDSMSTWGVHPYPKQYDDNKYKKRVDAHNFPNVFTVEGLADLIIKQFTIRNIYNREHVWFTGGEPSIYGNELVDVMKIVLGRILFGGKISVNCVFHICTSGLVYHKKMFELVDEITLDLKPPSSNAHTNQDNIDSICQIEGTNLEFKMAIRNTYDDIQYAKHMVEKYIHWPITVQPVYANEFEFLEKGSSDYTEWNMVAFQKVVTDLQILNPNVRLGLQLHKILNPSKLYGT